MTAQPLSSTADLARAAADAATIAVSFDHIRPAKAHEYLNRSEEALYAALDALAQAQMGRSSFLPVAAEILTPHSMERAA